MVTIYTPTGERCQPGHRELPAVVNFCFIFRTNFLYLIEIQCNYYIIVIKLFFHYMFSTSKTFLCQLIKIVYTVMTDS